MLRMSIGTLRERAVQSSNLLIALAFALSGLMPIILSSGQASAATLTSRKVTLSTSKISTAGTQTFSFSLATASNIGSMQFLYCTTPLGTCTAPTGMSASAVTLGTNTIGGTAAGFALGTVGNAPTANQIRIDKATPAAQTAGQAVVITFNNITNPSTQNTTFYPRITTYSDSTYTTSVDDGAVAASTAAQLTVNGRVQERLVFCVGAIDDVAALPTDCSTVPATTTIDIGVIDNLSVVKAPVNTTATNGANDKYGIAQVNTNAANGVVISYFPETASTGTNELLAFRVPGATCDVSGTSLVDQCFVNAAGAGETFVAGTERFGLNIPCIDTTQGTTANVGSVPAAYSNTDAITTSSVDCENSDTGIKFAWNNSTTATTLASSATVVDDEIIKLSFGATANATTPTGSYTVATTYIATPTF